MGSETAVVKAPEAAVAKPEPQPLDLSALTPERKAFFQELAAQARLQQAIRAHADWLQKAGGLPKDMSAGTAAVAMGIGVDLGFKMNVALQRVTVINGRTAIYGDAARSLILKSDLTNPKRGGAWTEWTTGTEGKDDYTFHIRAKRSDTGEEMERSFSIGEAKRAGLWGNNTWLKWGQSRMLRYRAMGFLARDLFSDILLGLHIAEELIADAAPGSPEKAPMTAPPVPEKPLEDPLFEDAKPAPVEAKAEPEAPFSSHAEADKAIAAQEQPGLFEEEE